MYLTGPFVETRTSSLTSIQWSWLLSAYYCDFLVLYRWFCRHLTSFPQLVEAIFSFQLKEGMLSVGDRTWLFLYKYAYKEIYICWKQLLTFNEGNADRIPVFQLPGLKPYQFVSDIHHIRIRHVLNLTKPVKSVIHTTRRSR